jgi:cytoskeletal protein RodZ
VVNTTRYPPPDLLAVALPHCMSYDDFVANRALIPRRGPTNSVGAFGDKFRKAREAKGISLDDVSNVTKISARNLKAIEEEHFDQLPGGVFNRGFIRAYAKHLGLNDEEAVTDYLACLRQAQIDAHEVWTPEPVAPVRPEAPQISAAAEKRPPYQKPAVKAHTPAQVPVQTGEELPELQLPRAEHVRRPAQKYLDGGKPRPSWQLIAVAAVVVVLAAILWIRHSRVTRTEAANAATTPTHSVSAPASTPATSKQPTSTNAAPAPTTAAPIQVKPTVKAEGNPPQPGKTVSAPVAQTVPSNSVTTQPAKSSEDSDVAVRPFTKPAASDKPGPTMTLVIRASETSWISVTADGQQVSQETLIAPAHTSIRASREIVARIGNAAGVTFLFNGQEIPAQGAKAEAKTFIFDAQGMRVIQNQ